MGQSDYIFNSFDSGVNYTKFDIVNGINSVTENNYYYSTIDNNLNQKPDGQFLYPIYSGVRSSDEVTLYIVQTGNGPNFHQGSIFRCNVAEPTANFTGMVTTAGSGWVKYTNGGKNLVFGSGGVAISVINPAWTTGFFFQPNYSTSIDVKPNVLSVKYGDSYSQRSRAGLNSNDTTWSMVFQSRKDIEARAIQVFCEDKGGVDPFNILIPVGLLKNKPGLKYIATDSKLTTDSHGLDTVTVTVQRVFDI